MMSHLVREVFYSIGKHKTGSRAFLHGCIEDVSWSKMKGELSCVVTCYRAC